MCLRALCLRHCARRLYNCGLVFPLFFFHRAAGDGAGWQGGMGGPITEEEEDDAGPEGGGEGETGGGRGGHGGEGGDSGREHLFEKSVTPSDVGKLNRLVIPKQHAERCFPLDPNLPTPAMTLAFEDELGKQWRFRYCYTSSSYLL